MQVLSLCRRQFTWGMSVVLTGLTLSWGASLTSAAVMSGIVPDAAYGNLELWLDVASLPTNSTSISTWEDKSSNGFDAMQLTPSLQPTYVSSNPAFTTWPTVHFNSALGQKMSSALASAMSITGTQPRSIFVAFKQDAITSKNVLGYGTAGGGFTFDLLPFASGPVVAGHFFGSGFDTIGGTSQTYAANQLTVVEINYDGTNVQLFQHDQNFDGQIFGGPFALNTGDSTLNIGAGGYNGYDTWNGDIAEVLVYSEVLSAQDRADVDNYLFTKYSMTREAFEVQFAVPEPGTGLLTLCALGFVLRRGRKNRVKS